ncbi:MAG TPA: XRE family transcriptional regulator [Lachnospiraceae bacterium]|nr:XRE family transcriptional regulator [Lachnospiraceae bacterium]
MNQYVTGAVIKGLRQKNNMTQAQLADRLGVSDKTVSKWETGKGYPDIMLLEPIAQAFQVSVAELLSGSPVQNANVSANMLRSRFYVCPICGNVIHSMGEAAITCHGVLLQPETLEESDEQHKIFIERMEDEYYVRVQHEMTKTHYISFIAAVSSNQIQLVKRYPEEEAEAGFKMQGVRKILIFCNKDGLFSVNVHKGSDTAREF